jgi:hypothetical protein
MKFFTVLGTLPGSYPPVLAWHRFEFRGDTAEHFVDDVKRAEIARADFPAYLDGAVSLPNVAINFPAVETVTAAGLDLPLLDLDFTKSA